MRGMPFSIGNLFHTRKLVEKIDLLQSELPYVSHGKTAEWRTTRKAALNTA